MTTTESMRGELPFPEAGEGVVLRFNNQDCSLLQKDLGDNWFADAFARLNRSDVVFIKLGYELGCKLDGKPARLKFDDNNLPLADLSNKILDALYLAVVGRTFEAHLEFLESKRMAVLADTADETKNP